MDESLFEQKGTSSGKPTDIKETENGFLAREFTEQKLTADSQQKNSIITGLIALFFVFIFGSAMVLFVLPFLLLNFIGSFLFSRRFRHETFAKFRLFPGDLILPVYPLSLGQNCFLTFRRRLKKNKRTKEPGELILKIACLERIEYKKGTDTEVEVSIIWESQPEVYSIPTGSEVLSLETNLNIPKHLPPSFEGKNNQIRWIISIEQNIPKVAEKIHSNFVIIIAPVVLA